MCKAFRRLLGAWLLLTLVACGGGGGNGGNGPGVPQPPSPPPVPLDPGMIGDGRFEALVSAIRNEYDVPALGAITVVGGVVVEEDVVGHRSIDGPTPATLSDQWHIGSVTKAMTATLVAVLVEQSQLTWDTTPADVWPADIGSMQTQFRNATVVDLLAHQAGLTTDFTGIPSFALTEDTAPGSVIDKRRLWAMELLQTAPIGAVGSYEYTNSGYIVAGAMLEAITGQRWETLMRDHLFAPLGMSETGFRAPGTPGQVDQPWGHWAPNGPLVAVPPGPGADTREAVGPAGNVHTTLRDYALFMFAHLDGANGAGGLVTPSTFQFLQQAVGNHPYALGWQVDDRHAWSNGPLLFHQGTNLRWVAQAGIIPGLDAGTLVVTNAGHQAAFDAVDELSVLLLLRKQASLAP